MLGKFPQYLGQIESFYEYELAISESSIPRSRKEVFRESKEVFDEG
jgi:hypothetical protein